MAGAPPRAARRPASAGREAASAEAAPRVHRAMECSYTSTTLGSYFCAAWKASRERAATREARRTGAGTSRAVPGTQRPAATAIDRRAAPRCHAASAPASPITSTGTGRPRHPAFHAARRRCSSVRSPRSRCGPAAALRETGAALGSGRIGPERSSGLAAVGRLSPPAPCSASCPVEARSVTATLRASGSLVGLTAQARRLDARPEDGRLPDARLELVPDRRLGQARGGVASGERSEAGGGSLAMGPPCLSRSSSFRASHRRTLPRSSSG